MSVSDYIEGETKFTFDDCIVYVDFDVIDVWFDGNHHQYVDLSDEAVEALKRGESPNEMWEDSIGNLVCIENSEGGWND